MKTSMRISSGFALLLIAAAGPAAGQVQKVGDVARNFTVTNRATKAPVQLTDFAGKIVVMDFFAYWCGPCQLSSPEFEKNLQQYYAARGGNPAGVPVQVISMNVEDKNPALTDAYIRNTGISYVCEDPGFGVYSQYYPPYAIPTFVVINGVGGSPGLKQWQILEIHIGWSGSAVIDEMRRIIDGVKASTGLMAPTITSQPKSQAVLSGQQATLSVLAAGWPSPTFQWLKDGNAVAGATADRLNFAVATSGDSGTYSVRLTNSVGSVTSESAVLQVAAAAPSPIAREIGSGRATYQLLITSAESWSVSKDAAWLSVSRTSGAKEANLEITAEANSGSSDRSATVTVGGSVHTVTQRGDGAATREAWAVGGSGYGQLGDNRLLERTFPFNVIGNVSQVAAGSNHTLFVATDGSLWAMGSNSSGQLGDGTSTNRATPVRVATGVQAVAAGSSHSLYLKTDGSLWAMGNNVQGQLGDGTTSSRSAPVQVATGVTAIAAGYGHSVFVKADGSLWTTGQNSYGQLGDGSMTNRTTPVQIATGVQSVAAGDYHSLYIKTDGSLWSVGYNVLGQLGDGTEDNRTTPVQVATGVQRAAAGAVHSLFVKTDGTVWAMGYNYYGQLGDGSTSSRSRPVQVATGVQSATAGSYCSLLLKSNGSLWAMGRNNQGQLGDGTSIDRKTPVQIAAGVQAAATGGTHTLFVKTDNSLWATGACALGQLGDGGSTPRTTPVHVAIGAKEVSAGNYHGLLVKSDLSLWGWGLNTNGQLGVGSSENSSTPLQVETGVQSAVAGWNHSLFTKTDGTLWGMGYNYYGQLGDDSTSSRSSPVLVGSGVRAAAAGYYHSLILKTDGSLWATGRNNYGQLGDGSTTDRKAPVQIATGVQAIAAGYAHSLLLKTDGTLWATGYNSSGQLGDGSSTNRTTPVQIAAGVQGIAAGYMHSLFLKTDGTLWGMGYNSYGQLGTGSTSSRSTPVQITSGVRSAAAGYYHSLFIKTDGSLWAMGSNSAGQLGDGTTVNRGSPVKVASNVAAAEGGYDFTLFITDTGAIVPKPQITSQPVALVAAAGAAVTFSVAASGDGPFSYQWRKDGTTLDGATSATLTLAKVGAAQVGGYDVVVTGPGGSVTSQAATLALESSRIANLSVRTSLAAGQSLTVGFVTSGSKRLLARAVGPSLYTVAGLTGFLPDPRLSLIQQGTGSVVAQNDNWDPTLSATCASLGAFPMDAGSKDCALVHPVSGPHTAQITGAGAGIVLVEVYDAESSSAARLTNVSARNLVGTGDNILIVGFVIDGTAEKTLLIRGIGPALRDLWGVGGVLTDPKLEIYRQGGPKLADNDNWDPALLSVFEQVGAFKPLAGSRDAALKISLPPGAYTVQVSGVGNVTGDGIVELYELP